MAEFSNIKIDSSRLYIKPLTYNQLIMYKDLDYALEAEFGLLPINRTITPEFKLTIENYLIPYIKDNPDYILFATIWIIVHKDENNIVGDIGFNAGPSEKGVIEVGYCTYPEFYNKGYMTEALRSIVHWAFSYEKVQIIIAQTDKDNFPTHRVLQKNHFEPFAEADNFYWWRLDKEIN